MYTHYYLPGLNVAFTYIYKNGCTSLLNYLLALENVKKNFEMGYVRPESFLGDEIHETIPFRKFRVESIVDQGDVDTLKLLVLRNPYQRSLSCWANKLLFAQAGYALFEKYKETPMVVNDFNSLESIQRGFESFAMRLATDSEFLDRDYHWKPQTNYFSDINDYNLVIETSNLDLLQDILGSRLEDEVMKMVGEFPRFNQTKSSILPYVGTKKAFDFIQETYQADIEALKVSKLDASRPPTNASLDQVDIQTLLRETEFLALNQRQLSELKVLRREIRDLRNSLSWRGTAWLRKLFEVVSLSPKRKTLAAARKRTLESKYKA